MKVDLALLHASVSPLFPFFSLTICRKKKKKKEKMLQPLSSLCGPVLYGMMLVKANILNDKEIGNSKKDGVK